MDLGLQRRSVRKYRPDAKLEALRFGTMRVHFMTSTPLAAQAPTIR